MSFLDAYYGDNQIPKHETDKPKTTFMTNKANICYEVMLLGIKNAGATYQRLMDRIFKEQIGHNIEVYVDNMIVMSKNPEQHAKDLFEVFGRLCDFDMKLNPKKCVFGVEGGKFLEFLLTSLGIEANPNKRKALEDMRSP